MGKLASLYRGSCRHVNRPTRHMLMIIRQVHKRPGHVFRSELHVSKSGRKLNSEAENMEMTGVAHWGWAKG